MDIKYNNLDPESSMSSVSQSTPLAIRAVVLFMSVFDLFQQKLRTSRVLSNEEEIMFTIRMIVKESEE